MRYGYDWCEWRLWIIIFLSGASFDGGERVDVVGGAYSVTSLFASHRPRCALCSRCGDCVGHALSGDASRASTSLRCLRRPRAVANRRGSYECRPASRTNGLRPKGSPSPLTALVSLATRGAVWVELGVGRGRVNYIFLSGQVLTVGVGDMAVGACGLRCGRGENWNCEYSRRCRCWGAAVTARVAGAARCIR